MDKEMNLWIKENEFMDEGMNLWMKEWKNKCLNQ